MALAARARRIARTTWLERAARFGLATRAFVYAVIAVLALHVAWGRSRETMDKRGALETIAAQPFGRALLAAVTAGFAGYAVWRLVLAVAGTAERSRAKAAAKRVGYAARGLLYAGIALSTAAILTGTAGEDRREEVDATAAILALPLGRALVGLAAAGFLAAAAYSVHRAATGSYRDSLALGGATRRRRRAATAAATLALASRAVVATIVALFLGRAAVRTDPTEAVGLDGALRAVARAPLGQALLTALAVGLLGRAVFGLFEARYRRVAGS